MEQMKPKPRPRAKRYEKSQEHVEINDETRAGLVKSSQRLLPGVNDLLHEVKQLKQQLSAVKEERDEFKEEVTFLKYQLAYRAQVENLQKTMSGKKGEGKENGRKPKAVRFSSSISIDCSPGKKGEELSDVSDNESQTNDSFACHGGDWEEYTRLKAEREELEDVLYDFYHDSKMANAKEHVLVGDIDSEPSESTSSLICRVLVNYEKLCEEKHILEEEKAKLDEDKIQLCTSMSKLREQLHDAVDSNIEEIEDLNRQNEELRFKLHEKENEVDASVIQSREASINSLRLILELTKTSTMDRVEQRVKRDISLAENELKDARNLANKPREEKDNKVKRSKSLPPTYRRSNPETIERGGLLRELKTCKELQESQRKQIQKILEEKLELEVQLSEIKRQNVTLKTERRSNIKTKSKHVQAETWDGGEAVEYVVDNNDALSWKCKELERKLEEVKKEKITVEEEKSCLLMSLDANIEKKDAIEDQLKALQEKVESIEKKKTVATLGERGGAFRSSYKKDISEVKKDIEKIRIQEQEKQIILLKRENDAVKDKLHKSEDMLKTLQNCLKELTDEKNELLDSIEELNEEKVELEGAREKLEKELRGTKREKFVVDEVSDIRKKEQKLIGHIEASKAKLGQLDLKMVEVFSLLGEENASKEPKIDSRKDVEEMIGSLLRTVDNLKRTVSTFKATYDNTNRESAQMKNELRTITAEKNKHQSKVEELNQKIKELTESLGNSSKSRTSYGSQISKELEKMRSAKTALEKSFSVGRKREAELERQLNGAREKHNALQKSFDELTKKCNEATSLLAEATKDVEQARKTNEKLTKELEQLREDLEGTVEDRDELLELLDRIVGENGSEEERLGLEQKVERIREKSRSEENLLDVGSDNSTPVKPVVERYLASSQITVECSSPDDNLFTSSPTRNGKSDRNKKRINELEEENQRLKGMVETILNDQKKMEAALSSFSVANAEIKEDLKDSIKQTKKIQIQRSENIRGKDVVDFGAEPGRGDRQTKGRTTGTAENAELRKLYEDMVGTNETLNAHIQRLQQEKACTKELASTRQGLSGKNASLENKLEDLTKVQATLEEKLKKRERDLEKAANEKQNLQTMLDDLKARMQDLKGHVDSLTEINKDLRETNEAAVKSAKDAEKKFLKMDREIGHAENANKAFETANNRLHKQVVELSQQKVDIELELQKAKAEVNDHSTKAKDLQTCVDSNEEELKILRETVGKLSELEEKNEEIGPLRLENEALKKKDAEHETKMEESEKKITRLKKDIENSQRFVKVVSQENDSLRDALSDWEREASKIRKHVHQVSQDTERHKETGESSPLTAKKELPLQAAEDGGMSVKALEAMQVEMDAVNKHLKSLTTEKKELCSTVETLAKENNEIKEKNIEVLTKYDMLSKEMEKKELALVQLKKEVDDAGAHAQTYKKSRDQFEKENNSLQSRCEKLEQENVVLRNSLGNTLNEEKALGERLKSLTESWKPDEKRSKSSSKSKTTKSDIHKIKKSEAGAKPDLIQHSKEVKVAAAAEEAKYQNEYFGLETSGERKEARDLTKGVSSERATLTSHCEEVMRVFHEIVSRDTELRKQLEEATSKKGKKESTKTALEKARQLRVELEDELENKKSEVTELTEEKKKLQDEAVVTKEKCDKLQAVFRALILVMNDKKSEKNGRQSTDSDGTTGLLDYIKNIKTKYTTLVTEKETLEEKVKTLQQEVEGYRAKEKSQAPLELSSDKEDDIVHVKAVLAEKERVLKELLLTSARDKRRFVEKLQEVYDEFDRVKTELGEELKKQQKSSPSSSVALDKVYQEFVESVTHTETFVQSVVHERRVTVVADTTSEKDANLELAKENEELIGRINAIKSSRRRETKILKEEIAKITQEKEDTVKEMGTKWKSEVATVTDERDNAVKEKKEAVTEITSSWKKEVDQLKSDLTKLSEENEETQRNLKNENRLAVERLEGKLQTMKLELDKMTAGKKASEAQVIEMRRQHAAEVKEKDRLAESEISHVRANWAEASRKVREATDEKQKAEREFQRVKLEKSESETKAARETQKLKANIEAMQKQLVEKQDGFKNEKDKLQKTIATLEQAFKKSEVGGLERTQNRISEFQRTLEDLAQRNKQLESARSSLSTELDLVKEENSKLQRDQRAPQDQRRVVVNNVEQPRRPVPSSGPHPAERVKVLSAVKQAPIDKPRLVSPLESAAPSFPAPQGDPQRRVKVRESQTAVIHKGRVQDKSERRSSDHHDTVCEELGAMFRQLNDESDWTAKDQSPATVIHARPVQNITQVNNLESAPQKPQPEWGPERQQPRQEPRQEHRQERSRPPSREPHRGPVARQQDTPSPTVTSRINPQPHPQRVGYTKEDKPQSRAPPVPPPKPIRTHARNTMQTPAVQSSSGDKGDRQAIEVRRVPIEKPARTLRTQRPKRPSVGSDDVFVSPSPTFLPQGAKNSDFYRSRSLDNLADLPDDSAMGNLKAKPKTKLPKTYSGPHHLESSTRAHSPGMTSQQHSGDPRAKKVTPLKGMEYVIFQHQL